MVNSPCALRKNVYSAVAGWAIPLLLIRSSLLIVLFRLFIYFLIFCLLVLSITERGILKSPTVKYGFVYLSFQLDRSVFFRKINLIAVGSTDGF